MNRRDTILVLLGLGALPLAAAGQPVAKPARIAYLGFGSPETTGIFAEYFKEGLRDLGYIEGRDFVFESRWALGKPERLPDLAKELGLDTPDGVVIASVDPGSAADEAGLRARDVILEVNRAAVKDVDAYQSAIKASAKGKNVLLLIRRGDSTVYVPIKPEA